MIFSYLCFASRKIYHLLKAHSLMANSKFIILFILLIYLLLVKKIRFYILDCYYTLIDT